MEALFQLVSPRNTKLSLRSLLLGAALGLVVPTACRTDHQDLARWATTQNGPNKLVAVMSHDKYPMSLRVDAAMTLIEMPPRGGRREGIDQMLEALAQLDAAERQDLASTLVPLLVQRLDRPPPPPTSVEPDPSIAVKDAVYGLLFSEPALLPSEPARAALTQALTRWALQDFVRRLDAPGQKVTLQQMMARLGPSSVRTLPEFIKPEAAKLDAIVRLIADVGDEATKLEASRRLVEVARNVASKKWAETQGEELRQANQKAGLTVEGERFREQLQALQDEEFLRIASSMRRLGTPPVLAYLSEFAAQSNGSEKQRAGALAALEKHMVEAPDTVVQRLVGIAGAADVKDGIRALALRRLGELPKKQAVGHLFELFESSNPKVRFAAGEFVLALLQADDVESFLGKLSGARHMSVGEPLRYGRLLGTIEGVGPATIDSFITSKNKAPVRLAALGYYYAHGTNDQLPELSSIRSDRQRVPSCPDEDDGCEWRCGEEEIRFVGDFFEYCVAPHMQARTERSNSQDESSQGKKGGPIPAKASQDPNKKK